MLGVCVGLCYLQSMFSHISSNMLSLTFKFENIVFKLKCQVFFYPQTCASFFHKKTEPTPRLHNTSTVRVLRCDILRFTNPRMLLNTRYGKFPMCHAEIPSGIKTWQNRSLISQNSNNCSHSAGTKEKTSARHIWDSMEVTLVCSRRFLVCLC